MEILQSLEGSDAEVSRHTVEESQTYEQAIAALKMLYVKTPNIIYARHILATRRQKEGESLDSFLQSLKDLS